MEYGIVCTMNNEQTIHRTRIKNDFRSNFWRFDGEKTIIDYNLTLEVLLVLKSWQTSLARFHRSFHLLHCCWILFLWSFYYPVGFLIFVFQASLSCCHFSARQQFSWHYGLVAVMNLDQTSLQRFNRLSIYSSITEQVYCKGRYSRRNHMWTVSSVWKLLNAALFNLFLLQERDMTRNHTICRRMYAWNRVSGNREVLLVFFDHVFPKKFAA